MKIYRRYRELVSAKKYCKDPNLNDEAALKRYIKYTRLAAAKKHCNNDTLTDEEALRRYEKDNALAVAKKHCSKLGLPLSDEEALRKYRIYLLENAARKHFPDAETLDDAIKQYRNKSKVIKEADFEDEDLDEDLEVEDLEDDLDEDLEVEDLEEDLDEDLEVEDLEEDLEDEVEDEYLEEDLEEQRNGSFATSLQWENELTKSRLPSENNQDSSGGKIKNPPLNHRFKPYGDGDSKNNTKNPINKIFL